METSRTRSYLHERISMKALSESKPNLKRTPLKEVNRNGITCNGAFRKPVSRYSKKKLNSIVDENTVPAEVCAPAKKVHEESSVNRPAIEKLLLRRCTLNTYEVKKDLKNTDIALPRRDTSKNVTNQEPNKRQTDCIPPIKASLQPQKRVHEDGQLPNDLNGPSIKLRKTESILERSKISCSVKKDTLATSSRKRAQAILSNFEASSNKVGSTLKTNLQLKFDSKDESIGSVESDNISVSSANTTAPQLNNYNLRSKSVAPRQSTCSSCTACRERKKQPAIITKTFKTTKASIKKEDTPDKSDEVDLTRYNPSKLYYVSDYSDDIFCYLKEYEKLYAEKKNFLKGKIRKEDRAYVVDWMFDAQSRKDFFTDTIQLGISIMDSYLRTKPNLERDCLYLLALASLFVAAKFEEKHPFNLKLNFFVQGTRFYPRDLSQMEVKILNALEFRLSRPIPIMFLRRFSLICSAEYIFYSYAKYFIDLALLAYPLCAENPSFIAAAGLFIAMHIGKLKVNPDLWSQTLSSISQLKLSDFGCAVNTLADVIIADQHSKFASIRKKYSTKEALQVSKNIFTKTNIRVLKKLATTKFEP